MSASLTRQVQQQVEVLPQVRFAPSAVEYMASIGWRRYRTSEVNVVPLAAMLRPHVCQNHCPCCRQRCHITLELPGAPCVTAEGHLFGRDAL